MIGEQNSQENAGVKNVSTKVPLWVANLLNIICRARGTDIYGLMQLVLEFIIETAKVNGPVPPQMQALLHMLKMDADWNKAFSFSSPTATMDVAQVILVTQQYDGKGANRLPRKGYGLVMIDKPAMPGQKPRRTYCVDDILERVVEVSMAGLYRELRQVQVSMKSKSVRETLMTLCDAALIDLLDEADRDELPKLGDYHDFGKVIEWGNKQKRKPHRTPDSVANAQQQTIQWTDDDREIADYEAKDWEGEHRGDSADDVVKAMGCKPFDVEP